MKGIKLFLILKELTTDEVKDLKKAVHSPIYTTNKRVKSLYEVLRHYHPKYPETQAFKEKIFKKIYPNEAYEDQKLRRVFSQLREITEQFLIHLQIQTNTFQKERLLANAYKERKLYSLYQQKATLLRKNLEAYPCLDVELLRERALLNKEFSYFNKKNFQKSYQYLAAFIDDLNQYFLTERCMAEADLKVLEKTWGTQKVLPFTAIIQQMKTQLLEERPPNLQLYIQLSTLSEEATIAAFEQVKDTYFQYVDQLTSRDQLIIFTHLTNFCTHQINLGDKAYSTRLMNLYQAGLEKELLYNPNGLLDSVLYRNIGMLAILNKNFNWANQFLHQYETRLDIQDRHEVKSICMGFLHFYQNNYDKTVTVLVNKNFKNINNILSAKDLVLRCYFELFLKDRHYYPLFDSFAQSFTIYIKRKGIASSKGERYLTLIKFLQNIATKIYSIKDYKSLIQKWEEGIQATEAIASRKWVLNKINSFKTTPTRLNF